MLSPEALSLEESLAVSALSLSVCSQFVNTAKGSRVGPTLEPAQGVLSL